MWLALALAQPAPAAEQDTSEEIIVWGDRFARWERRWYVETEVRVPYTFRLFAWNNHQLDIGAYQLRAVLDCDKDFQLGRKSWEVSCEFEDVALVVIPVRSGARDLEVAQQIDDTLTGARFQLQVSEANGVPNVDLEGSGMTRHRRHRQRQEQMRQLIGRAILPFHLKLPSDLTNDSSWYEYNSQLLTMPYPLAGGGEDAGGEQLASMGGATMAHFLNDYQDHYLVQSIGKAILTFDGQGFVDLRMHGVALFEPETGIMSERVWAVTGGWTASSPSALDNAPYRHSGRIAMLGEGDRPDVGDTYVVGLLDAQGRVRPWIPLETAD